MEVAGARGPVKPLNLDSGASTGQKPRLSESDVKLILPLKSEACPTPEDSERAALARRIDAMWNEFRDDVVEQFFTKGYVEVEHGYFADRASSEAWVREKWATWRWSKFELYRPGDEGLDDFMVRPGEDAEEAVYYGQE